MTERSGLPTINELEPKKQNPAVWPGLISGKTKKNLYFSSKALPLKLRVPTSIRIW